MRKVLLAGLLFSCIASVFLLCCYTVPYGDELAYAYAGQNSYFVPWPPARVQSFYDILVQQWNDYHCHGNGRVWLQVINAIFSWQRWFIQFRILNAVMWFVFVWLVLRAGKLRKISLETYMGGFAFVFWFFWYSDITSCNACFALSYLWIGALTIVMVRCWQKKVHWWLVPFSAAYGWTHEVYVLPFLGASAACAVYGYLFQHRREISYIKLLSWLVMLVGACFLCFGPAARLRAQTCGEGLGTGTLLGVIHLLLVVTPAILLLLVGFILFVNRNRFRETVERDLFWWMYFGAAFAIWICVCSDVFLRTACAWFLAAIVLCVANRSVFHLNRGVAVCALTVSFVWLFSAACMQAIIGTRSYRMLEVYRADPQGVTYYDEPIKGPFFYTCNDSAAGWGFYYQLEISHPKMMSVFPVWLYDSLYLGKGHFWREAECIGGNVYAHPRIPNVLFVRGVAVSVEDRAYAHRYFSKPHQKREGWRRYLPGRFSVMFSNPDEKVELLSGGGREFQFVTKTGDPVVILRRP